MGFPNASWYSFPIFAEAVVWIPSPRAMPICSEIAKRGPCHLRENDLMVHPNKRNRGEPGCSHLKESRYFLDRSHLPAASQILFPAECSSCNRAVGFPFQSFENHAHIKKPSFPDCDTDFDTSRLLCPDSAMLGGAGMANAKRLQACRRQFQRRGFLPCETQGK